MAGLRGLLDHPGLLADDSRPRRVLALVANVAVRCAGPGMDGDVGGHAGHYVAL